MVEVTRPGCSQMPGSRAEVNLAAELDMTPEKAIG
jgi:hypothetical protein